MAPHPYSLHVQRCGGTIRCRRVSSWTAAAAGLRTAALLINHDLSGDLLMERRHFLSAPGLLPAALLADNSLASDKSPPARSTAERIQDLTQNLPPAIRQHREVAMKLLQPTSAELERGLRLHAESIVFDAYGFAPRAAIDLQRLNELQQAGASDLELDEAREDMSMTRCVTDPDEQREFRNAWTAAGVTCIFQNAGQEGQAPERLLRRLARFTWLTDMLREFTGKAVVPEDIRRAQAEGRHMLYLTGNGIPLLQRWDTPEEELMNLRIFFQLGIRMMHLTYQRRNMIGDGCGESSNAGLSDFGRLAIREMNRIGIIPDCAHSGWQTSLEAARVSSLPVVASHSTAAGIFPHIRSKPDEVIRAIADSGGYVGICCIPRFLRGNGDLNAFLDHIEYVARRFGPAHVAIGTDVATASPVRLTAPESTLPRQRRRAAFRSLWPADTFSETAEMSDSLSWTNWPMFTVGLVQRGFSDAEIRLIIGENVMRVATETLQAVAV